MHNALTRVLSAAMIVIGVLLIARGAALTVLLGVLFIVAGSGRIWLSSRDRAEGGGS
jgi:uncharacterized membrane protein HdeD (DUF308 family)